MKELHRVVRDILQRFRDINAGKTPTPSQNGNGVMTDSPLGTTPRTLKGSSSTKDSPMPPAPPGIV